MSTESTLGRRPELPEQAIRLGEFGGRTLYYHDGVFINATTGRHLTTALSREQHRLFSALLEDVERYRTAKQLFSRYVEGLPENYTPDANEASVMISSAIHRLRNVLGQVDPKLKDAIRTKKVHGYRLSFEEE